MNKLNLHLERYDYGQKQTIGRLFVLNPQKAMKYHCNTLELPWRENQTSVSCIPEGDYIVQKRFSQKFKHHFHVTNVRDRSYILIHKGNYYTDIRGCILVGLGLADINADGLIDVTRSGDALADLLALMPNEFNLKITSI